jgi:hypothetical protein
MTHRIRHEWLIALSRFLHCRMTSKAHLQLALFYKFGLKIASHATTRDDPSRPSRDSSLLQLQLSSVLVDSKKLQLAFCRGPIVPLNLTQYRPINN